MSEVVGLDTALDLDRYTVTQIMAQLLATIRTTLKELRRNED
jgi:hypothetical protein